VLPVLPSSHCSVPWMMPLPQMIVMHADPGVGQMYPSSSTQRFVQPSPLVPLRSSHCSLPATIPSPQDAAMHAGSWRDAVKPCLHPRARRIAAVACCLVAVVAGFARVEDAVAARVDRAWLAWDSANVACLQGASRRAAVARQRVAVVAGLAVGHRAVAAVGRGRAVAAAGAVRAVVDAVVALLLRVR
jgi:hypothetical protein